MMPDLVTLSPTSVSTVLIVQEGHYVAITKGVLSGSGMLFLESMAAGRLAGWNSTDLHLNVLR